MNDNLDSFLRGIVDESKSRERNHPKKKNQRRSMQLQRVESHQNRRSTSESRYTEFQNQLKNYSDNIEATLCLSDSLLSDRDMQHSSDSSEYESPYAMSSKRIVSEPHITMQSKFDNGLNSAPNLQYVPAEEQQAEQIQRQPPVFGKMQTLDIITAVERIQAAVRKWLAGRHINIPMAGLDQPSGHLDTINSLSRSIFDLSFEACDNAEGPNSETASMMIQGFFRMIRQRNKYQNFLKTRQNRAAKQLQQAWRAYTTQKRRRQAKKTQIRKVKHSLEIKRNKSKSKQNRKRKGNKPNYNLIQALYQHQNDSAIRIQRTYRTFKINQTSQKLTWLIWKITRTFQNIAAKIFLQGLQSTPAQFSIMDDDSLIDYSSQMTDSLIEDSDPIENPLQNIEAVRVNNIGIQKPQKKSTPSRKESSERITNQNAQTLNLTANTTAVDRKARRTSHKRNSANLSDLPSRTGKELQRKGHAARSSEIPSKLNNRKSHSNTLAQPKKHSKSQLSTLSLQKVQSKEEISIKKYYAVQEKAAITIQKFIRAHQKAKKEAIRTKPATKTGRDLFLQEKYGVNDETIAIFQVIRSMGKAQLRLAERVMKNYSNF